MRGRRAGWCARFDASAVGVAVAQNYDLTFKIYSISHVLFCSASSLTMSFCSGLITVVALAAVATAAPPGDRPWMDKTKTPRERAALLLPQLNLEEKVAMTFCT